MPDLPPAFAGFGPQAASDELWPLHPSRACPESYPASGLPQVAGDGQFSNALANEHQVLVWRFQRAAHVVGYVCRSAPFDPAGKLLHCGAQCELVLIEAVEQAGDQFGIRHSGSTCFRESVAPAP